VHAITTPTATDTARAHTDARGLCSADSPPVPARTTAHHHTAVITLAIAAAAAAPVAPIGRRDRPSLRLSHAAGAKVFAGLHRRRQGLPHASACVRPPSLHRPQHRVPLLSPPQVH
jgi:hypothetical protein